MTSEVTQAAFEREDRYIVIKRSHHTDEQLGELGDQMFLHGIGQVRAVVVEADWPEYEPVWRMIEDRVSGLTAHSGEGRSGADAPRLNVKCEITDDNLVGTTYLEVLRVEAEDDGSFTAVVNHWPAALNARQSGEGERNSAIEDIAAERQRQIETEGWTPEHDDVHADGGELSRAAACYAAHASAFQRVTVDLTAYRTADPARHDYGWPWSSSWWKPSTPRRDLVKAGALIVAEIERLDRAALRATDDAGGA